MSVPDFASQALAPPESVLRLAEALMSASISQLCDRVRPELACLGDTGAPLVAILGVVERAGSGRDPAALEDPSFALEILTAASSTDPMLVGRVLDYLRSRVDGTALAGPSTAITGITVAEAVKSYKASALALMAKRTIDTYSTWINRLVEAHADDDTRRLTAGDLQDLIAIHVLLGRDEEEQRRSGRTAETTAVTAYRHLVLVRHLATASSRDPPARRGHALTP